VSIILSFGRCGWYAIWGYSLRICCGWLALTIIPDDVLSEVIERERARMEGKQA
jgi:hypothetical protein